MSNEDNNDTTTCCAACGIAEVDDVKLVPCDDCDLVKYCSVKCREEHKSQHEEACRKRAAELRDKILFMQPESSNLGDCPICSLPLPLDRLKSATNSCCSKLICNGCRYANIHREKKMGLRQSCPFCREPVPDTDEECVKRIRKRIEANDPVAMSQWAGMQYEQGDYCSAFEYFTMAAELGYATAHFQLSVMYHLGHGVEEDEGKAVHHLEEAAIGGNPSARYNLGWIENKNGNVERAVKHNFIAARQGQDDSIKWLMKAFKHGYVNKDDLAAALRAHQAAVDETKSPQREAAEEWFQGDISGWASRCLIES